jgi:hypothetical protein
MMIAPKWHIMKLQVGVGLFYIPALCITQLYLDVIVKIFDFISALLLGRS